MNDGRRWINKQFGVLFDSSTLNSCRTYLADHWWMEIRTGSIRTSHGCCYRPPTFVLLQQRPRRITGDNYCIAKGDPIYWIETAGIWIHLTFDPSTLAIIIWISRNVFSPKHPRKPNGIDLSSLCIIRIHQLEKWGVWRVWRHSIARNEIWCRNMMQRWMIRIRPRSSLTSAIVSGFGWYIQFFQNRIFHPEAFFLPFGPTKSF